MISVIIPFKNEADNLPLLVDELRRSLDSLGQEYEVLLLDNGSTDQWQRRLTLPNDRFKVHSFRISDKGRTLRKGIRRSQGDVIVFMDADLQDDPDDLPRFWRKLQEGYEFVNGYRRRRKDNLIRTIPSRIGNRIILKYLLGSKFNDINCGYKMFRRECLDDVVLYGDNFRFLPLVVEKLGYKTTELEVRHHSRKHGVSKYGFFRRFTVFADILTAYFIFRFAQKPLHFFGAVGGSIFVVGVVITGWLTFERLFMGVLLRDRPLLLGGILLIILGVQIVMTGITAELIVYTSRKLRNQ
jgi:glycosyltransferase involved in cell wall biosynthesis